MKIRIAGILPESYVDGTGIRMAVFVQGCPHRCPGCHNPETHDFGGGWEVDTKDIVEILRLNQLLDGVTFSGGEPFCQPEACAEIARAAHRFGLNVWAYSGWTLEELRADQAKADLLREVDVLVDGRFVLEKKTYDLPFRGSENQRVLRLKGGDLISESDF